MDVIKRVDDLCKLHNMSKYRLSQITGISQSAFSKLSRQQSSLSVDTIQRICNAFGISMAQFFEESDAYPDLTPQQLRLLAYWDKLSNEKKEYALLMIEKLSEL